MAFAPPELSWVWEYLKGMTINIMVMVFWLIKWLILTTNKYLFWHWHSMLFFLTVISNLFLMYLNWSLVFSGTWTYSTTCTHCSNCFVISRGLITSSLTKYSGLIYGHIFLVPSRLILLPRGSTLFMVLMNIIKDIGYVSNKGLSHCNWLMFHMIANWVVFLS